MKLTIPQPELAKALAFVSSVVPRRSTLPILDHVLIEASDGSVKMSATDLQSQKTITIEAGVYDQGAITVPARKLNDIVKSANPDSDIQMSINAKNKMIVKSGRSRFTLSTLPAAEYPNVISSDNPQAVKVDGAKLAVAIKSSFPCTAQNDVRYYLTGMLFNVNGIELNVVATDGHRMAKVTLPCESLLTKEAIIPRESVVDIQKMLEASESSEITISDSHIAVCSENMTLLSKLIDGKFPAYERVIPKNNPDSTVVNRQELISACNRGLILANEKYRGVRVGISDNELIITGNNPDQEQAEETIPCRHDGQSKELGINGKYLLDALAPIESENVTINSGDAGSAIMIEDGSLTMVVMLMRL